MQIREITDKHIWEDFLQQCEEKTFFQSWNWGEFHEKMGRKIWRFGFYNQNELVGVALVVKVKARRGTFLAVEHGPTAKNPQSQILQTLLDKLKEVAKEEDASFIRISPTWKKNEENEKVFRDLGFRPSPTYAAAESSWKLDITPREEEILAHMRKTTRYLIRQVMKNQNVEITRSEKKEDLEIFDILTREIGKRQQFVPFSRKYSESEFDAFSKDNAVSLFFGKYKGEVVAAALIVFWSGIGFYHQAASRGEYAKLSIPYLLQWEAIREAKKRGCVLYDFWGYVDPKKYPNHPWAGPTLFKMGFGGKAYEYVKTQDYPLSWKYWPIAIFELLRKKRRRL